MKFKDGKTKMVKTRNMRIFSRFYLYCNRDFGHCIPNARRLFPVRRLLLDHRQTDSKSRLRVVKRNGINKRYVPSVAILLQTTPKFCYHGIWKGKAQIEIKLTQHVLGQIAP